MVEALTSKYGKGHHQNQDDVEPVLRDLLIVLLHQPRVHIGELVLHSCCCFNHVLPYGPGEHREIFSNRARKTANRRGLRTYARLP